MAKFFVVADYRSRPSEGIQVVSKTLVDGLRAAGHVVQVVPPRRMPLSIIWLVVIRPRLVVFTHGPGVGVLLWSVLLRLLTSARIMWVATRPDLARPPRLLRGRRSAHVIIGNGRRPDLERCAPGSHFAQQYLGIDPARLGNSGAPWAVWPELASGVPTALHVGHLRDNRGLDLLVDAKRRVGDRAHIIVLGSPTFPADPEVQEALTSVGVVVHREYMTNLAALYSAVDLYLFPVRSEAGGAIDLPLGVLEAVACRTRVVSTPFGSLPDALRGVPGVRFADAPQYGQVVADLLLGHELLSRPAGLPDRLHAREITAAVLKAAEMTP